MELVSPSHQRIRLNLCYQGTHFFGWQRQPEGLRTIQGVLEKALHQILGISVGVVASGRTDTGVHARLQVCHFDLPFSEGAFQRYFSGLQHKEGRFLHALNSVLPEDLRVLDFFFVASNFHAQKSVLEKTYQYFVNTEKNQLPWVDPFTLRDSAVIHWDMISKGCELLQGTHSFRAFCDKNSSAKTFVRTILDCHVSLQEQQIWGQRQLLRVFHFKGTGFLKHMVRSLVGTLLKVGKGQMPLDQIQVALQSEKRHLAGPTAPPQGLWLWDILYQSEKE